MIDPAMVRGLPLAPGSIVIPDSERAELAAVLGTSPPADGLHPLHAYIAMQRGIGVSIEQLCALADFDIQDGPMMGSLSLEILGDLDAGYEYRVEGEIVDLEHREGRRFPFDLLTFCERLIDAEGAVVARTTNTFVLPRIPEEIT